jgi:3-phosphoshikimate 1-carboxyvinyltransferase
MSRVCRISKPDRSITGTVHLDSSKSESNRALIIQALCKSPVNLDNLSKAQDTRTLMDLLKRCSESNPEPAADNSVFDVGNAGTAIRFLTAYFSTLPGTRILTGDQRMKQRPIKPLVDALSSLGARIEYIGATGYPPLKITGGTLSGNEVDIDGSLSSQYASALLLIGNQLQNGLKLKLKGEASSLPYISMTVKMLQHFNVGASWSDGMIALDQKPYQFAEHTGYKVEADWSAASYWYSIAALADNLDLRLMGLKPESLQGDRILKDLYSLLGVKTDFIDGGVRLTRTSPLACALGFDFSDCPDIAQTFIVTAAALRIPVFLNGLRTLKIKETDRIQALKTELLKMGIRAEEICPDTLEINEYPLLSETNERMKGSIGISYDTYDDHRMAMSFAPLAMVYNKVEISNPDVVKKSYPAFWEDLQSVGFKLEFV